MHWVSLHVPIVLAHGRAMACTSCVASDATASVLSETCSVYTASLSSTGSVVQPAIANNTNQPLVFMFVTMTAPASQRYVCRPGHTRRIEVDDLLFCAG